MQSALQTSSLISVPKIIFLLLNEQIPTANLQNLVESFPRRLKVIVQKRGLDLEWVFNRHMWVRWADVNTHLAMYCMSLSKNIFNIVEMFDQTD